MYFSVPANRLDIIKAAAILAAASVCAAGTVALAVGASLPSPGGNPVFAAPALASGPKQSAWVSQMLQVSITGSDRDLDLTAPDDFELRHAIMALTQKQASMQQPSRPSSAIELALHAGTGDPDLSVESRLALANELNAALAYENLQARMSAITEELAHRQASR